MDEIEKIREKKLQELKESLENKQQKESYSEPINVNDADVGQKINENQVVVIDCWAPWCGPCKTISPVIDRLAARYAGKILFCKLNVDQNKSTAMKYGINSIPTILIFKNSDLVDKVIGAVPENSLTNKLDSLIAQG